MAKTLHTSKALYVCLAIVVSLGFLTTPSYAGPYKNKDFTLRFSAALTRFANYGDVAGIGGASAGSKWSSSINPASTDWLDIEGALKTYVTGQYSKIWFKRGSEMNIWTESVSVDCEEYGTIIVAAGQVNTNQEQMNNGLDFRFAADIFQIQWGKKLSEDCSVGFNFGYTDSRGQYKMGRLTIANSNCDIYGIRGGVLVRIVEGWLAGVVLDYGWSSDRSVTYGFGAGDTHANDHTRQILVRPGVSWEYKKDSGVYMDYQFGTFWNSTGQMNVHRLLLGVDHAIVEGLFVRSGTTVDVCKGLYSIACGIGFYPTKWFGLDVAYQYEMFPELIEEFGRAHTLNVSISFTF
jgi:hypothetical protein